MPSSYSTNLKIELQATGENSGTWGTITNTNLGTALEQAIVGYGNPSYASDANLTLTYTDTNAAQAARALVLNVTSAVSLSATRELVVPTIQKQYIVQNNTSGSQSITVKTSAGTGITVPNGRKAHLYVDGTNVIYMDDYVDINGGAIDGTPIGANSASTGAFTTLSASGNITVSGGTANGVLYLNGSKVATSGSAVTYDGTTFGTTGAANFATSSGNVGIGTSSPVIGFTVQKDNGSGYIAAFRSAAGSPYITLQTTSGITQIQGINSAFTDVNNLAMQLSGGNLGIGTSSPAAKLHVSNGSNSDSGDFTAFVFGGTDATNSRTGSIIKGTSTPYNTIFRCQNNTGTTSGSLIFQNGSTEQMRLDSSGNLGLGVTPSAWSTGKAFEFGDVGNAVWGVSAGSTFLLNNAYYNGGYKYARTGAQASYYQQNVGIHAWFTAPSGTAGNAITFTQAMTLDITSSAGYSTLSLNNSTGGQISFQQSGSGKGFIYHDGTTFNFYNAANGANVFWTNGTERARITSAGNVGIGTTNPGVNLEIGSDTSTVRALAVRYSSVPAYLSNSFDGTFGLTTLSSNSYNTSNGSASWSAFSNTGYGNAAVQIAVGTGGADVRFFTAAAANTNPTERARITSGGNLLLGTTGDYANLLVGASSNFPVVKISRTDAAYNTGILALGDGNSTTNNVGIWRGAANSVGAGGNVLNIGGYDGIVFTASNAALGSQTERARITSGGDLVVGGTSVLSSSKVTIYSAANAQIVSRNTGATAGQYWRYEVDASNDLYIINHNTAGVYIANGGTSWSAVSDERLKTNLVPIENAVEKVSTLRAVTGRYKTDEEDVSRAFLIAQDVQAVLPEAVNKKDDDIGTLGLAYTETIPLLVAAIKEQQAMINELKAEMAALKGA